MRSNQDNTIENDKSLIKTKGGYLSEELGFTNADRELIPIYISILKAKVKRIIRKHPYKPKNDIVFELMWRFKYVEEDVVSGRYISNKGFSHIKDRLFEYIVRKRKRML